MAEPAIEQATAHRADRVHVVVARYQQSAKQSRVEQEGRRRVGESGRGSSGGRGKGRAERRRLSVRCCRLLM